MTVLQTHSCMYIDTCCLATRSLLALVKEVRDVPLLAWTVFVQGAKGPPVVCHWPPFTHRPSSPLLLWSRCLSSSVSKMPKSKKKINSVLFCIIPSFPLNYSQQIDLTADRSQWIAFLGHLASGTKLWTNIQWSLQLGPTKCQHLTGSVHQQPNRELNQMVHVWWLKKKILF